MTKKRTKPLDFLRRAIVAVLIAAFAVLTLPVSLLGRLVEHRGAAAETEAETTVTPQEGEQEQAPTTGGLVDVDLTINYYRVDGEYDYWNIWQWEMPTGNGANYAHDFKEGTVEFKGYEGKKCKTITTTINNVDVTKSEAIGVIVRYSEKSDWEKQTPNMYVDGSKIVYDTEKEAYTATVYVTDGVNTIYYTVEDAMSNKISSASFDSLKSVEVITSAAVTAKSLFKIKDEDDNVIGTLDMSVAKNLALVVAEKDDKNKPTGRYIFPIKFENEVVLSKSYTIVDEPTAGFDKLANFVSQVVTFTKMYDSADFEKKYSYTGTLGAEYSKEQTKFTVWSPYAATMTLNIYAAGEGGTAETHEMTAGEKGTWTFTLTGDQKNKYYTYTVGVGSKSTEIVDPYARSAGRNGKRGMIVDLDSTDPEGWANHARPENRGSYSNAIIYETHIRDLTMHESSNVSAEHKGKFLGLTETSTDATKKTALDRIKDLGVTEVHILPMYDINSVDEYTGNAVFNGERQYNWGYDPLNYNVPEGSYSTDPTDGNVRVNELKQMVMALHKAGIRVIMDVVYNHVADAQGSNFQALMPNYYFRTNSDGSFTNGSGCGNDTASERAMYHKFMVDSVNYWADEYQLDGFRFDLMGLHDTVTMNEIYNTLKKNNPTRDIMVYGEGWKMGTMVETDDMKAANMYNAKYMPNIAFFNDMTRDALKGGGFGRPITEKGFVEGALKDAAVYIGAVGGTNVKDAGYSTLTKKPYASDPSQNINYVSCHDNTTLWDKINASVKGESADTLKAMNRIAAAAVLTSQGPAFFLAGEEMLRSKPVDKTTHGLTYDSKNKEWKDEKYDSRPYTWASNTDYFFSDNSYKSPDSVNAIDWSLADTNADMVDFYKQLIALRKNTPQFRLSTKEQIDECVKIPDADLKDGITSYVIKDPDSDEYVVVLFNVTAAAAEVKIPNGSYSVYVNGDKANATEALSTFKGNSFTVGAFSAVVMKSSSLSKGTVYAWMNTVNPASYPIEEESNLGLALGLGIGIPAAVLVAGGAVFGVMYSKKKNGKKSDGDKKPEAEAGDEPKQPEPSEAAEEPAEPETASEGDPADKE